MVAASGLRWRAFASLVHLGGTALAAGLSFLLVFGVWFPAPFDHLAGGRELFWIIIAVDLVLGPSLTFVIFSKSKSRRELAFDLSVVVCCQVAALAYGLHTTYSARPVALVFEVDRFRVIAAPDVRTEELASAEPVYRQLPNFSIWTLGTRPSRSSETLSSMELALTGFDVAQRPSYWQDFELSRADALKRSRPLAAHRAWAQLKSTDMVAAAVAKAGTNTEEARFLPLVSRFKSWTVILDRQGYPMAYLPVDGF